MKLSVRYQILLLIFFTLVLYYPAIFAEINTVDDERMITSLMNMDAWSFKNVFFPGKGYYYRPLLMLTFFVDKDVWGLHESFMHLENILLHVLNTTLVFGIAWNIGKKWHTNTPPELPFIAALFFAVHPIATESANWISGRTDLLAGTLLFLALYLLLLGGVRVSQGLVLSAAFSFLLACLSKDSAIAAFPALIILAFAFMKSPELTKLRLTTCLSFTGAALSYFVIRRIATGGSDSGIRGVAKAAMSGDFDLFDKIRIVVKVFGFYVKKLLIPWPLNFAIIQVSNEYVVGGGIALIACLIFLYRRDIISALFLLAASTVVPALFLALGPLTWTPIAERYVYMSTAPLCIATSFIVFEFWKRFNHSRLIVVLCVGYITLFAYSTWQRTLVWQNNLLFFQDAVKKTPDFPPLKNELATALQRTGRIEEANRIFRSNILPNNAKYSIITDMNRARVLMGNGKTAEARNILLAKKYERGKPLYADYLEMLIAIDEKMLLQPDFRERAHFEQEVRDALISLAETSGDPVYYYRIGKKFLALGMKPDAAKYFNLAYEKSPESAFYKVSAKRLADKLAM